jgi:hypothetical protein
MRTINTAMTAKIAMVTSCPLAVNNHDGSISSLNPVDNSYYDVNQPQPGKDYSQPKETDS